MSQSSCLFCRIVNGELDSSVVYEGDKVLAFLDLYPLKEGHTLIIPRRHCNDFTSLTLEEREELFAVAQKVMLAQRSLGLGLEGANLLINDGPAANQHVPHLHLHVVPRRPGDTFTAVGGFMMRALGPLGMAARRRKLDELAARLKSFIEEI